MQRHPNNMNWLLPALVGSIWLLAAPAAAQTYKWTDADGKVHYSDQPPPANIKETVTVKPRKQAAPANKDAPAAKAKDYVEQEAAFKKRQVEAAEREAAEKKAAEDSAEKKRNCDQVRTQLKSMQAGGRVVQANAQGEREYMSDAQIAQEIERLKKAEASLCK